MNVQNIPRDDKVVKAAFRPKLDAFLFYDYPNIEAKLLAFYLDAIGFPEMAQAFREGLDLHKLTAAGIYGVPVEEVTDAMRQTAKRVNFSIIYGGGVNTLIEQKVVKDGREALDLLRRYHATWPGIGWATKRKEAPYGTLSWWVGERVKKRGHITTLYGRHLHPHSGHVAINCLCQGCAADLMKSALVKVHRFLVQNNLRSHLVNVVHDELKIDAAMDELPILLANVPDLMNNDQVDAVVPIRPEPDISYTTWADKAPYLEAAA